jgi:hypothetical protein
MTKLHDTQWNFSRFVFRQSDQLPEGIITRGLSAEQRLSIYRNNTQAGLTEALRGVYPVIDRLVGEAFFNRLAEAYINQHPPRSAVLIGFGQQFAAIIADFKPAKSLPYLPDIACLEWQWHEAYHEADDSPLTLSTLAQLDIQQYARLGFKLHSTARFLKSPFPIAEIWEANQAAPKPDALIDLNKGGCYLLIYRPDYDVQIVNLTAAEYQMLTGFASGLTLPQTIGPIMAHYPDFDLQPILHRWLLNGLMTDYHLI